MRMTIALVYFTSLSILQIFYVTGVSVSLSSPSTAYSSISSQPVPTYNGNLHQKSMFSTIKPYKISGGTLTRQINNLNTRMSSNIDLGQNSNEILAKQVDQQRDNNDANVSENIITNTLPSEISSSSSISSTTTPNFEIPVHINVPELSNIYHKTSKISDMSHLNEVNKLDSSNHADEGFQLGEFGGLIGSISEDDLNLVDSLGGLNDKNENAFREEYSGEIGENETHRLGKLNNRRRGHKSRKINLESRNGGSTQFSLDAGKGAKQGFIGEGETIKFGELSRNERGRIFIGNDENNEEGREKRFSGSVGSIQFSRKNGGRVSGLGGKEEGDKGFSRSNRLIRFGRKKRSGSDGLSRDERVDRGFGIPNRSIRFNRNNKIGIGGSDGKGLEGDISVSRSNGSIRFGRIKKGKEGRLSGEEEEEGRGFSGSVGSLSFGKNNKSGIGGSSGENIKIIERQRAHRTSMPKGIGKEDISGGKRISRGPGGGMTFNEESGDKGLSKSNSINISRTVGNYGGKRFDGYNESNGFSREYSTGGENNYEEAFGEFGLEKGKQLKWAN